MRASSQTKGDAHAPKWLQRTVVHDELRSLGLPWVPEAWWRKPADGWLTLCERLDAIAVACELHDRIRRRIGPPNADLRNAVWRCTVAALALTPRDRWPTRPTTDDVQGGLQGDDEADVGSPLVIRRRGDRRQHGT